MKIMLCHNFYRLPGGEDQVYFDEAWLLEQNGHTVVRYEKANSEIDGMSRFRLARATVWNSSVRKELDHMIRKHRPDVVHFHNTFPLISPAAYLAASSNHVPVVQSLHNYRMICPGSTLLRDGSVCEQCAGKRFATASIRHGCYRKSRFATGVVAVQNAWHDMRGTLKDHIDSFIALTNHSREQFVQAGFPEEKIEIKPNFVRPDPGERKTEGDYAVYVGRLSPEKGVEVLLEAWQQAQHNTPLVIVGDGPLANQVERAANESANIRWLGQVPFEEALGKIQRSRMLIMPSIWYETFGRSMIEAFAAGVPVVASNIGAMKEIVSDGINGLHFTSGCAKDLENKVRFLDRHCEQRLEMGKQARKTWIREFSPERNYQILKSIYDKVLQGNN